MRIQVEKRALAGLVVLAITLTQAKASQSEVTLKEALKCRVTVASKVSGLIKTGFGVVDKCHGQRDKGAFQGDCNAIASADGKGKFAKLVDKFLPEVDKKCSPDNPVRGNFPNGFVEDAIERVQSEIEANSAALLGTPALTKEQKIAVKCHAALAKGRLAIVGEILKAGASCQKGADKAATTIEQLTAIASDCLGASSKAAKVSAAICKACGGKDKLCDGVNDVDPGLVDSCSPLPSCVIASATATGEQLARALYGQPTECGNHVIEVGEDCDDGDLTDGDGCDSNCTPTGCGNGVTSAGEQCDDGNDSDFDDCVGNCQAAVCGDGFVHAGVELCGDGAGEFCTNPQELTCDNVVPCLRAAETGTIVASIASSQGLGGLVLRIDYPEHKSILPGLRDDPGKKRCAGGDKDGAFCTANSACPGGSCVDAPVTILPAGGFPTISDLEFAVSLSLAFPGDGSTFAAGPFARVVFNHCEGVTAPTLEEFACIVDSASDGVGGNVPTDQVSCSLAFQ